MNLYFVGMGLEEYFLLKCLYCGIGFWCFVYEYLCWVIIIILNVIVEGRM